jgi:outer membrane lipoprotein-sorting protein
MVHRNWPLLLTIMLLLFLPMRVGAEVPGAEELFQKLLESFQTVDFEGKLTLMSPVPDGSAMREALVIRKAPDKQRIEFIWPEEIRGMGMTSNGKERWRIQSEKDRRRRPLLPRPPNRIMDEFPLKNIRLLLQNYDVRTLHGGRVADRGTYLLEIDPKAAGRPSRKVWIDAEMGIILKMEHYDSQERLGQVFAYSEINFKPEIGEAVFRSPGRSGAGRKSPGERVGKELWNYDGEKLDLDEIRKEAQLDVIIPDQAPAGFILQSIHAVKLGERKNVHLRYTDGLAILSVFQSPSGEGIRGGRLGGWLRGRGRKREDMPPWRGGKVEKMSIDGIECDVMSRGPMFIFRWNYGGLSLTLMGELERKEMVGFVSSFVSKGG